MIACEERFERPDRADAPAGASMQGPDPGDAQTEPKQAIAEPALATGADVADVLLRDVAIVDDDVGGSISSFLEAARAASSPVATRELEQVSSPATTDRWRYSHSALDAITLANIGNESFSHRAYMRQYEDKPPAVRVGMFVACNPLADEEPTAEYLRRFFCNFLEC